MARRIVIEEECEHGQEKSHYLPHDDHQGPHVLRNRYGPDCPHCPGGSRRVLDPDEWRGVFYEWLVNGATGTWQDKRTAGLADSLWDRLVGGDS